ncbi:MAG: asparagine synthase-related protein [Acidimicrobiia bacterium]
MYVLFSGGVDSSLLLALATKVARERGLAEPTAITYRYDAPGSAIDVHYQECAIAHIRATNWAVLERGTAELIGPDAAAAIATVGVLQPAPSHVHLAAFDLARQAGPSPVVMTGEGGDETFAAQNCTIPRSLAAYTLRHSRQPRQVLARYRAASRWVFDSGRPPSVTKWFPWLTPEGMSEVKRRRLFPARPPAFRRLTAVDRRQRRGYAVDGIAQMSRLADSRGVELVHPLLEDEFVTALTRQLPVRWFTSRSTLIGHLWPGLLPAEVLYRTSKGEFTDAYFGSACREFAARWTGDSLASPYIDNERLRASWLGDQPWPSAHLLQVAWASECGLIGSSPSTRDGQP